MWPLKDESCEYDYWMGPGPIVVIFVGQRAERGFRIGRLAACGGLLDEECVWLRENETGRRNAVVLCVRH